MIIKRSILLIVIGICGFCISDISAQSFYSFQSINKHTFFFSISWQKKIVVGVGYGYRTSDTKFVDITAEWKAPIDELFNGKNFEVISGAYARYSASRSMVANGFHLRIKKTSTDAVRASTVGLGISFLPGYQYAAPLDDGLNGVIAARISYIPTIFASVKDLESNTVQTSALSSHTVELGAHLDMLIKRSASISVNPFVANTWAPDNLTFDDTPEWEFRGDLYFGSAYFLERN